MALAPRLSTREVAGRVISCPSCSVSSRKGCCTCNGLGYVREALAVVGVRPVSKLLADRAKKRDKDEYDKIMKAQKKAKPARF